METRQNRETIKKENEMRGGLGSAERRNNVTDVREITTDSDGYKDESDANPSPQTTGKQKKD